MVSPITLLIGAMTGLLLALRIVAYWQQYDPDGFLRPRKIRLAVGVLVGIPALVTAMMWYTDRLTGPPSDREMLTHFQRHRATFDHLAGMVQADKRLKRVDYNWTDPADPRQVGVSPARISEYRRLLDSAGVHRGFEVWDRSEGVKFLYWGQGSAISSDTDKGFAYLTKPPKRTLASLDACGPDKKNGVLAYRHIEGNWYLFYEDQPG